MPGAGFLQYFLGDQPDDVLLSIEGVSILDIEPPAPIKAVGTGVVCLVAEFEDGPFLSPFEVASAQDVLSKTGTFGFTYGGVVANNPCARTRNADGTMVAEHWNGNGYLALQNKRFYRLVLVRPDTSVGQVTFKRCASLVGTFKFTYLLTSGQAITFNDGASHTATFTGTVASVTGAGGTFGTIAAGDTVTLGYDDPVNHATDFQVTFLAGDTTVAAILARINQYAGFPFASNVGGQLKLTGAVKGLAGQVRVVSGSTGVLTILGLTAANTAGGGNVQNILAVTLAELAARILAASGGSTIVDQLSDGRPRMVNTGVPLTGTLLITASTAIDFGFAVGVTATAATGNKGVIPAGTRVTDDTTHFVTMQSINVSAIAQAGTPVSGAGPYSVKVRHATDDGTGIGVIAGDITTLEAPINFDAWLVVNNAATTAALAENQLDNAYLDALDATLDMNTIAAVVNIIYAARQSNAIRGALKQNAFDATAGGLAGRMACARPPLGTDKAVALSNTTAPGVGATRDQRLIYTYPGWTMRVRPMAQVGTTGGAGFTADGIIDIGSDGFLAALMSLLPPEENPAQETPFMGGVLGVESGVTGLTMPDYKLFKAGGICAPRYDAGLAFYESGVTSVDPTLNPGLVRISRRRMGDYLQGTCARIALKFVKKLSKAARRKALLSELRAFAKGLMGLTNESQRRIKGFTIKDLSTPQQNANGLMRVQSDFALLSSMDQIALMSSVGENVQVTELAPGETQ